MITVDTPQDLKGLINQPMISAKPVRITCSELEAFIALSADKQWIHDPQKNQKPIIPGNFLIAKLPYLLQQIFRVKKFDRCITAKYENIKFKNPVYLGDRIGTSIIISKARTLGEKTYVTQDCQLFNQIGNIPFLTLKITEIYHH